MNEVMSTAQDEKISIYYQDTDSMHIMDKDIAPLTKKYKELYGRDLVGKQMGQFHSDFKDGLISTEAYIISKKTYIDILNNGEFHTRIKGIPKTCFSDPLPIFEKLYKGGEHTFNLLESQWSVDPSTKKKINMITPKAKFLFNKNGSISNLRQFSRTVSFPNILKGVK
jgi:hypothetical protein